MQAVSKVINKRNEARAATLAQRGTQTHTLKSKVSAIMALALVAGCSLANEVSSKFQMEYCDLQDLKAEEKEEGK